MILALRNVSLFYGSRLVFRNVSLELEAGGITLLTGANGAGKTTLLRIMAGLIRPSAGRVETGGPEPRFGYLGHATFLYPGLSLLDNLAFWAKYHGLPRPPLEEILERVELGSRGREPAGSLSRGLAQRLSLARLLLLEPSVLLLDEPGAGLDGRSLDLLRREASRAAGEGAAIVWASNTPEADLAPAHRVVELANQGLRLQPCAPGRLALRPGEMPPPPHLPPRGEYRPRLLASVLALAGKDLRLLPRQGGGLGQGLLLGLLLIFLFSLASAPGQPLPARMAAAVFWTASLFCQTLLFSALYALEETDGQRQGLLLTPLPLQAVWLGKALGGFCLLLAAQGLLLPATAVFLGQGAGSSWLPGLAVLLLADLGTAVLGSLLGALAQGSSARESLLGILLFPLQAPLLLAGIALGTAALGGPLPPDPNSWLILALAFDAVFLAAGLGLFAHIYNEGG